MKYLVGSKENFHEFIDSIKPEEKVGVVTHTDLDGIASGIFMQKILESKGIKIAFVYFANYGVGMFDDLIEKKDFDVLLLSDMYVDGYPEELEELRERARIFAVDHHPTNDEVEYGKEFIKTDSYDCASQVLFDLAKDYMNTSEWEWLVCSAIVADYGWRSEKNMKFLQAIYPGINKENLWEQEAGKRASQISNALIYFEKDKKVYDLVIKRDFGEIEKVDKIISKEIEKWEEKIRREVEYFPEIHLRYFYGSPKFRINSIVANILSSEDFLDSIVVFVADSKSKKGFIKISSRNNGDVEVHLGELLRKCTEGFEDTSAGGHPRAAAGIFPKKYLKEFKKRLVGELKPVK